MIHDPAHCIKKVLHHSKPNLKIASIKELDAEISRTAIIHLQDGVTAVGEKLHFRIVAVVIANPRPSMNQQHEGEMFRFHAWRSR